MYQSIESRFQTVKANVDLACSGINQSPQSVKIIAVSKLQSTDIIKEAYDNGVRDFGENYAQELAEKSLSCTNDIVWHFIGPIQSNKVSLIAKHADWVHSIDREKIAKKLNGALEAEGKKIHALVQVNIDREESKSGIHPEDVISFANNLITHYPNLMLEGLMFMPKINTSKKAKMDTMNKIINLQKSLISQHPGCKNLSLGTSGDFEESIIAGSTIIRIGEGLLGKRP